MPKIDEITYESDITTFIDYASISSYADNLKNELENINAEVLSVLDCEINKGGLDIYAANINGMPIFHDKAIEAEQKVQAVYTECNEIADKIKKQAKDHRTNELKKYKKELDLRKTKIEDEIKSLQNQLNKAYSAFSENIQENPNLYANGYMYNDDNYLNAQKLQRQINNYNKELEGGGFKKGLKKKLEEAEKELEALN